jgi:hypothetical protein
MRFQRNRYRRCRLLAAALLLAGLAIRGAAPAAAQDVGPEVPSPPPAFEFHSGFWVNLHVFLYAQSRIAANDDAQAEQAAFGAQAAAPAPALSPAERQTWNAAVAYYASDLGQRDLTTSLDFARIADRLGELETCTDLSGRSAQACTSGLRPELIRVLESAAPIYRAHWWPQHDRANRAWIAQAAPPVLQMGADLADRLTAIYQEPWPSGRLRVDVVSYAGSEGAYTTLDPPHLMIASQDPRNQGLYGFEVLFHQASEVLAGGVLKQIDDLCRQRDLLIPRDLGSALLYYTTGYAVQHELAQRRPQDAPYTAVCRSLRSISRRVDRVSSADRGILAPLLGRPSGIRFGGRAPGRGAFLSGGTLRRRIHAARSTISERWARPRESGGLWRSDSSCRAK